MHSRPGVSNLTRDCGAAQQSWFGYCIGLVSPKRNMEGIPWHSIQLDKFRSSENL